MSIETVPIETYLGTLKLLERWILIGGWLSLKNKELETVITLSYVFTLKKLSENTHRKALKLNWNKNVQLINEFSEIIV